MAVEITLDKPIRGKGDIFLSQLTQRFLHRPNSLQIKPIEPVESYSLEKTWFGRRQLHVVGSSTFTISKK